MKSPPSGGRAERSLHNLNAARRQPRRDFPQPHHGAGQWLDTDDACSTKNIGGPNGELADVGSDVDDGTETLPDEKVVVLDGGRDPVS
jgi:hypothetical protein